MILNKYFLENPSSSNNPNILHQPPQTTAKYPIPTSTDIMGPRPSPYRNFTDIHLISFLVHRKLLPFCR
jgi:hypothetical protein